ncbi:Probable 1%2C4-alpha-glucan branching enzyme [Mycobacteroides abscessus]|nr:Probable 1%2C4-alpha-glucan branching enzyme [Mycobacteroides abscessus]
MSPSTAPLQPDAADIARLLAGTHHNPHSILGAHEYPRSKSKGHTVIRAFKPGASAVAAVVGDAIHHMTDLGSGLFAVALPFLNLLDYRLDVEYGGTSLVIADAYRFLPTLGEVDLHLFNEGRHERLWEILGAHPRSFVTADGEVSGVSFAVWAPNARGVSVIGDFNGWNGNDAPMRTLGSSGAGSCSGRA